MNQTVIWITGATSGIGEAVFREYNKLDFKLIISGRNSDKLDSLKGESKNPENVHVLPLDLTNPESFPNKVSEAIKAFGRVDILLNNGGISQRSLIKDTTQAVDRQILEINFFGTIGLSKTLLPHFIENKNGHFAVVSSLVGKFGSPYRSSYAASKHALHGFFDTLRAEHYKENIAVTMICPGFIRTSVSLNALTGDGTPLQEMDDAQEKGMSPEVCAKKIVEAISKRKEEVNIGGKEIYAVALKRFFPLIFSRLIQTAKVR